MKFAAFAFTVALALSARGVFAADPPPMIVHECGTFTCLQDESGRAIGGINTDDEPAPAFVNRTDIAIGDSNAIFHVGKSAAACDPRVTMRLEKSTIFFYLPHGDPPRPVSVKVEFHGGRLTEYYPRAQALIGQQIRDLPKLSPTEIGTLSWPMVTVGSGATRIMTDNKAWTTLRSPKADPLGVGGQSEDFLFYDGVGAIDAPLKVERIGMKGDLQVSIQGVNWDSKAGKDEAAQLAHTPMWLVCVGPDGHIRWRRGYSPTMGLHSTAILGDTRVGFTDDSIGLPSLHNDMAEYLVKAGLFSDEAEAMLNTWEISYFKSPGTRLFFLVPRSWTDVTLPLHISGNPRITRVMVGRIELVTPEQRKYIKAIESPPLPSVPVTPEMAQQVQAEVKSCLENGRPIYPAVNGLSSTESAYVLLGRFRAAILLDEQKQHPNAALAAFLSSHGIHTSN